VSPLLDDPAMVEDDDVVGLEDGIETVRDDEDGASLHQLPRGLFEQGFGLWVETGGGFVEDKERRVPEEGAGEGEALRLSAGETRAAFADDGLVFFGERLDEIVQARGPRGRGHFGIGRVRFSEADVGGEGVVENVRALGDPGDGYWYVAIGNW
jgi:hypothetical protein